MTGTCWLTKESHPEEEEKLLMKWGREGEKRRKARVGKVRVGKEREEEEEEEKEEEEEARERE